MKQLTEIAKARAQAATLVELTSAFEGIASTKIAQIKSQVQSSEQFFADLWQIYTQIRVDKEFHFGRGNNQTIQKELLILITSETSFSGDIDERLVNEALGVYDKDKNDIIVIGRHGAVQLMRAGAAFIKSFKLPTDEQNINLEPLVAQTQKYFSTLVFYQSYKSLMEQNVKTIKLATAVQELSVKATPGEQTISEVNYIFEPSVHAVVDHLESSMIQIALSEVILESKLAQSASRFRSMRMAHEKADESHHDIKLEYQRTKRHIKDERLKELLNSMRGSKS